MADSVYDAYRHDVLTGDTKFNSDTIQVAGLTSGSAFSNANATYAAISGSQILAPVALGTKTVTDVGGSPAAGIASGGSLTFTGVPGSGTLTALVMFSFTNSSRLMFWWDSVVGFPLTLTGADITLDWNGTTPTGKIVQAI